MRSVAEIKEEIDQIGNELEQAEFGSYEWDELERELSVLDHELRGVLDEVDRIQEADLYHYRDLQNKGLVE